MWDGENKYEEVDRVEEDPRDWTIAAFAYNELLDVIVYLCNDKHANQGGQEGQRRSRVMIYGLDGKERK